MTASLNSVADDASTKEPLGLAKNANTAEREMSEWIWLVIGAAWGLWINLGDAKHYKNIVELQARYIKHLHRKFDGEDE